MNAITTSPAADIATTDDGEAFPDAAAAALRSMAPTDAAAVIILGRDGLRTLLARNTDARTELRMAAELITGALDDNRPGPRAAHPDALRLALELLPRPDQPDAPPFRSTGIGPRVFVVCSREKVGAPVEHTSGLYSAGNAEVMAGMLNAVSRDGAQFWFQPADLVQEGAQ